MSDVKMSDEVRARMMSLMPCTSTSSHEWIPDLFKEKLNNEYIIPEDHWPVFQLRPFTTKEHANIRTMVIKSGKLAQASNISAASLAELQDNMYDSLRKIVVGWSNIKDWPSGVEYTYEQDPTGGVSKDKWEFIPDPIKQELFKYICRIGGLVKMEGEDRLEELKRGL